MRRFMCQKGRLLTWCWVLAVLYINVVVGILVLCIEPNKHYVTLIYPPYVVSTMSAFVHVLTFLRGDLVEVDFKFSFKPLASKLLVFVIGLYCGVLLTELPRSFIPLLQSVGICLGCGKR
jgi:hypothetical protein